MYQLETDELLVILRALHFYEDKLANTAEQYRADSELDKVTWLRMHMGNKLKFEARID